MAEAVNEATMHLVVAFLLFGGGWGLLALIAFTVSEARKRARRAYHRRFDADRLRHNWIRHY